MGLIKQVIVMRRDLHMRKGKIAAQAGHACVEAVLQTLEKNTLLSELLINDVVITPLISVLSTGVRS